jgi:hypothetical protein
MFAQALLYLCHPSAQRQGTIKRINQRFLKFAPKSPRFFTALFPLPLVCALC